MKGINRNLEEVRRGLDLNVEKWTEKASVGGWWASGGEFWWGGALINSSQRRAAIECNEWLPFDCPALSCFS